MSPFVIGFASWYVAQKKKKRPDNRKVPGKQVLHFGPPLNTAVFPCIFLFSSLSNSIKFYIDWLAHGKKNSLDKTKCTYLYLELPRTCTHNLLLVVGSLLFLAMFATTDFSPYQDDQAISLAARKKKKTSINVPLHFQMRSLQHIC